MTLLHLLPLAAVIVFAIHRHMTGVEPMVVFLHYFGQGEAGALARGVRAAIDELGKPATAHK